MKKQISLGTVLLLTCCFYFGFLFSNLCTLHAAKESPDGQSEKTTTGGNQKKQDVIPYMKKSIEPTKPPIPKVDLTCWIRAFYDEARTKPLPGNTYRYVSAPEPKRLYVDVIIKNVGTDVASAFKFQYSHTVFIDPIVPSVYLGNIANLGPGESYLYQTFIIMKDSDLDQNNLFRGRDCIIKVILDWGNRVREDNERNNECIYTFNFRP